MKRHRRNRDHRMGPRIVVATVAWVVTVAATVAPAAAEPPAVRALDEAQLLAALAASSPRADRLAAEVDAAEAEVVAAGVRADPSLGLDREEVFPDGGVATSYLRLTWPVDLSGRRSRRVGAARAAAGAVAAEADLTRVGLEVGGLRTFYRAAHA